MSKCPVGKAIAAVADLARAKPSRREARRDAIMQAATQLFAEKGYGATGLNDVVRLSGGSLSTLYDMFGNKAGLFHAIVTQRCALMTRLFDDPTTQDRPIAEALVEFGTHFLTILTAADTVAVMRSVMAEAFKLPELAQAFYDAGPLHGKARVERYLDEQSRRGILTADDPMEMATDFYLLVVRDADSYAIMGLPYPNTPEAIHRQVTRAVDRFLRLYGAVRPAPNAPGAGAGSPAASGNQEALPEG